jgi:hypothetical protein
LTEHRLTKHGLMPPKTATVGIAQWLAAPGQPAVDNGGLELLGGSQVIAPDGAVVAAAPRGKPTADGGCRHLVVTLPLRESLARAARESGPLLVCRRPPLYSGLVTPAS